MSSFIYNSALNDSIRGNIDFDSDTFYVMLVASGYAENQGTHSKRSDVTNEITGTGYTAGGKAAVASVAAAGQNVVVTFGDVAWPDASITARKAVYYKRRGGAAGADELVAVNDFGADYTSTSGEFKVQASTMTFANAVGA